MIFACKYRFLGGIYERAGINPKFRSYITCFTLIKMFITGCMKIVGENYEKFHFLQNRGCFCQARRSEFLRAMADVVACITRQASP
jgi:hypothetical protein